MLQIHIYPEKKKKIQKVHFSKLPPMSQKTRFPIHPVICISSRKIFWNYRDTAWRIQKLSQSAKEGTVQKKNEREKKDREAQRESKRRRGEERDGEQEFPLRKR